eukprot:m.233070 g.233070  ORF g.233070 m.233070 type:complete len:722 (+) comp54283_c0_seq13:425-2590(+)
MASTPDRLRSLKTNRPLPSVESCARLPRNARHRQSQQTDTNAAFSSSPALTSSASPPMDPLKGQRPSLTTRLSMLSGSPLSASPRASIPVIRESSEVPAGARFSNTALPRSLVRRAEGSPAIAPTLRSSSESGLPASPFAALRESSRQDVKHVPLRRSSSKSSDFKPRSLPRTIVPGSLPPGSWTALDLESDRKDGRRPEERDLPETVGHVTFEQHPLVESSSDFETELRFVSSRYALGRRILAKPRSKLSSPPPLWPLRSLAQVDSSVESHSSSIPLRESRDAQKSSKRKRVLRTPTLPESDQISSHSPGKRRKQIQETEQKSDKVFQEQSLPEKQSDFQPATSHEQETVSAPDFSHQLPPAQAQLENPNLGPRRGRPRLARQFQNLHEECVTEPPSCDPRIPSSSSSSSTCVSALEEKEAREQTRRNLAQFLADLRSKSAAKHGPADKEEAQEVEAKADAKAEAKLGEGEEANDATKVTETEHVLGQLIFKRPVIYTPPILAPFPKWVMDSLSGSSMKSARLPRTLGAKGRGPPVASRLIQSPHQGSMFTLLITPPHPPVQSEELQDLPPAPAELTQEDRIQFALRRLLEGIQQPPTASQGSLYPSEHFVHTSVPIAFRILLRDVRLSILCLASLSLLNNSFSLFSMVHDLRTADVKASPMIHWRPTMPQWRLLARTKIETLDERWRDLKPRSFRRRCFEGSQPKFLRPSNPDRMRILP